MRRRSQRVLVVVVLFLAVAKPALAQGETVAASTTVTPADLRFSRWEISLGGQIGAPKGFVKVGEFNRSGDKLRLNNDLNIDTFEVASLGAAVHLTERDVLRVRFDYTFLYGTTTRSAETAFNGALLAAEEPIRTRPVFTRVTGLYEHDFVREPSGALVAGGVGLTFVYLHFKLHGTLAPDTVGHETQEDFYAQELPVPLFALRGEYPITPRVHLLGAVDGGFLPKVNSLRTEGGTVDLAQAHADVFAGVRYAITPNLMADGGYTYTYFSQHETSHEDDNKILFLGHAFGFDLTYRL
jgi:opacity protein-like surface antigen